MDLQRVLNDGPWTFEQHVFVFARYDGTMNIQEIPLTTVDFWVQVHDVKPGFWSKRYAKDIGNHIGTFLESDKNNFEAERATRMPNTFPRRNIVPEPSIWLCILRCTPKGSKNTLFALFFEKRTGNSKNGSKPSHEPNVVGWGSRRDSHSSDSAGNYMNELDSMPYPINGDGRGPRKVQTRAAQAVTQSQQPPPVSEPEVSWQCPLLSSVKCNMDASLDEANNFSKFGFVLRDHSSRVIAGGSGRKRHQMNMVRVQSL
ncbi:hypothetical protein LguiA_004345 [Lonicera macranthoides]